MKLVKLGVLVLGSAIMLSACNSNKIGKTAIKTEMDSLSYAIGINIGNSFKTSKIEDVNVNALAYAIQTSLDKDTANELMTMEEAGRYIQKYFQAKEMKKGAKNLEAGKKFLEENAKKEGVITDESGLQYKVITEGTGPMPKETDVVKVHYTGTLIDGTQFDSSREGEPAQFPLNGVIRGWTIGLQKMKVGSKYMLYIPAELGYGMRQMGDKIEPNSTLVFEVELLEIVKQDTKK